MIVIYQICRYLHLCSYDNIYNDDNKNFIKCHPITIFGMEILFAFYNFGLSLRNLNFMNSESFIFLHPFSVSICFLNQILYLKKKTTKRSFSWELPH